MSPNFLLKYILMLCLKELILVADLRLLRGLFQVLGFTYFRSRFLKR